MKPKPIFINPIAYSLVLGLILFVSACDLGSKSTTQDEVADIDAIKNLGEEGVAAINAGDADRYSNTFTDDAVRMSPGGITIGKEAIRTQFQAFFKEYSGDFTSRSIEEIVVDDRYAFTRGSVKIKWTPVNEGEVIHENSKFLSILQRQPDGSWKVARFVFDADGFD